MKLLIITGVTGGVKLEINVILGLFISWVN